MTHLSALALCLIIIIPKNNSAKLNESLPIVITTWAFTNATEKAWKRVFVEKKSALDAVQAGCKVCEVLQCDGTVGYGGSPDENGETTLDAMIMDGATMNIGAVASLRRIKDAISVARYVMDYTQHSILAGDLATEFAIKMKFHEESLSTNHSTQLWKQWKNKNCQPNFWINVDPDPKTTCGPYRPNCLRIENEIYRNSFFSRQNHDTIGMVVIDNKNNIAAGTSTNGVKFKIPGRVGDSPIPGAGAYADNDVGGAAATGDGDIMLRFLPSYLAVEEMRRGTTPEKAAKIAIRRIGAKVRSFMGGVVAVDKNGTFGAACSGMLTFPFSIYNPSMEKATVYYVKCITL